MFKIFERRSSANDPFEGVGIGDEVEDTVTGFTGVAMARAEYLTGCHQVYVLPRSDAANELKDGNWFDIERIRVLTKGKVVVKARPSGADLPKPQTTGRRA